MRRHVLLVIATTASGTAFADDPRDLFGFEPEQPATHADCSDGRTLGCASATDPFDPVSPYALRTWLPTTYLLQLPVGDQRHDDVAAFATGAYEDAVGVAFGGATGLENTWTIEGAPVENFSNGNVDTRVPLVFLRGIHVTAGGFSARDRAALGGSIEAELIRGGDHHEVTAHVWSGVTAPGRERPIAAGVYQLRRLDVTPAPEVSFAVTATGPVKRDVFGGKTWYAAGVAGFLSLFDLDWHASRLLDADNDGIPDGLPGTTDAGNDGKVDLSDINDLHERVPTFSVPMLGRAGWQRGPHEVALSLLVSATRDGVFLSNATQQAAGIDRTTWLTDGIASWKGSWKDTRATATLSWHRSMRREKAHDDAAAGIPQLLTAYVPRELAEDPALATICDDTRAEDPTPLIPNCPVPFGFFASGGAGELDDVDGDRPTASAEIAHLYEGHVLRLGGTFQDDRLVTTARFTGGEVVRSLFEGHTDRTRLFGAGGCDAEPGSPCDYVPVSEVIYRTRYSAAYAEDTFSPARGIRVDAGLRWELMWVGPRLHFSNEFAPRVGAAWDFLGDGTSRVWASMGRTHALLPAGMGFDVIGRDKRVRDIMFGDIQDRRTSGNATFSIQDGVQAIAQDEATAGIELGLLEALRGGVWVQRRTLRRGLETVLATSSLNVFVDNPGRSGPFAGLDARRDSTIVAIDLQIAPSDKLGVRATYLWGETIGSWTGPFDPRQGTTLYTGTDWDLDGTNLYGRLPTDPGQRLAVEAERRGAVGGVGLSVATRFTVASGRPRNVLGDSDFGIVQLLPRGSNGRTPTISQANVRLAARWHGTDITLDVFNVFDRRDAVATSELYTSGAVRPIDGGTQEDLVFAKDENCGQESCLASPAARRSSFGLPTAFQRPLSVTLGIHRAF